MTHQYRQQSYGRSCRRCQYSSAIGGVELYFDGYEVNVELEVADEAVGTCIASKRVSQVHTP